MDRKRQKLDPGKVTAELEQVKEENSQLKSKVYKIREPWTEFLYENERLPKNLQDLESANINLEEKSRINLRNSDLTSQVMKIEESNDVASIDVLPDEMILKIFGYVDQNQLGQIARVCSRWNMLTRSPALWKNVDVKFQCSFKANNTMTMNFINMLPSCVTSIRLYYSNFSRTELELNFAEFCLRLQRRCPHLERLILEKVNLSDNFSSVIGLCTQFLPGVKILVFRHSTFSVFPRRGGFGGISKIEVLEAGGCIGIHFPTLQFSNMPQLRVLNFGNSWILPRALLSVQNQGLILEELYLCGARVQEGDLRFSNSTFPHLKIICLCLRYRIFEFVPFVIQSCQSLQKVYIDECCGREKLILHPFFKDNRCKSKIIEAVAVHHSHNVDYSY